MVLMVLLEQVLSRLQVLRLRQVQNSRLPRHVNRCDKNQSL
jgi:hypothetical protein